MNNSMYMLMDLVIAGFAVYILYQYIVMVKSKEIRANMLLPKELEVKRCKDQAGYIKYIGPKLLAFGLTTLICGVIGLVQDYTGTSYTAVYMGSIVVCLACIIWYTRSMKKAVKEFWAK